MSTNATSAHHAPDASTAGSSGSGPGSGSASGSRFAAARRAMVDSQLRTSGVNEPYVLSRMLAVPREKFVPQKARGTAYIDRSIALDNGRRIAAPVFYGMLLEEADPRQDDRVLIVDAGSGYLPALIEPLVAQVQIITPEQANDAASAQDDFFSLVLIDGAVENVPRAIAAFMTADARLVTGLVTKGVTRLAAGRRSATDIALLPLAELGIPRIADFDTPKSWSF